ncbi:MAG: hypothetical protein LBP67_05110 [Bacteroidales bacterium]|jgi:hypothetical protein|nr:hypothetical protein [Bacteroidales bacterium]
MRIKVELTTEVIIEFDENSKEFKELFEVYNQFYGEANYKELAENIALNIGRYGTDEDMEVLGQIKRNGQKQYYFDNGEQIDIDSPINLIADYDMNGKLDDFDIYSEIIE